MQFKRLICPIFAMVVGFSLTLSISQSIYAQIDDLTPIYTDSTPEQFIWSANSARFVFLSTTIERRVQLSEPNWYSYEPVTATLSQSSIWPLQPVLSSAEIANFNPFLAGNTTLMYVSPNERYVVYTIQDTQDLAIGDRQLQQSFPIPNFLIPDPTGGSDQFRVLWSADSTAFVVIYEPGYNDGDELGTFYVRGFADEPAVVSMVQIGATLIDDGRTFQHLNTHDISEDGSLILLSGDEIFRNTDLPPSNPKLILWDPDSPDGAEIFDMLGENVIGASFEADENSLLLVNERGLIRFNRTTGEITLLNSDIDSGWVTQVLFSPHGEYAALIYEDIDVGNTKIYVIPVPSP